MTALLDIEAFEVAPFNEVALAEIELADLLARGERMHRSNIQHDSLRCLVCFERR